MGELRRYRGSCSQPWECCEGDHFDGRPHIWFLSARTHSGDRLLINRPCVHGLDKRPVCRGLPLASCTQKSIIFPWQPCSAAATHIRAALVLGPLTRLLHHFTPTRAFHWRSEFTEPWDSILNPLHLPYTRSHLWRARSPSSRWSWR